MNFVHFIANMLNCKHHIQLGPDDIVSFPAVYGAGKANSCSLDPFICDKKASGFYQQKAKFETKDNNSDK